MVDPKVIARLITEDPNVPAESPQAPWIEVSVHTLLPRSNTMASRGPNSQMRYALDDVTEGSLPDPWMRILEGGAEPSNMGSPEYYSLEEGRNKVLSYPPQTQVDINYLLNGEGRWSQTTVSHLKSLPTWAWFSKHYYLELYVYADESEDGDMGVTEAGFERELQKAGVRRNQVIASYADGDQDGYTVFVKVKGVPAPGNPYLTEMSDADFNMSLRDVGSWP